MKANLFFHNRSFHSHSQRQSIPLPEPFEKIREALANLEQRTEHVGGEWSPAQWCRREA